MPPPMPRPFLGSSTELLVIELAYFLVVVSICLIVYFRTKSVYKVSQHTGLFHFRNIFLYFAFAYFFRLIQVLHLLSTETMDVGFRRGFLPLSGFVPLILLFVNYFSTMAILSLAMAVLARRIKKNGQASNCLMHAIALVSSVFVFATRSNAVLILAQTIVLLGSITTVFMIPSETKSKRFFSQNKATYLLLAVFWIANLLVFSRRLLPEELKIILYILSAAVFFSILLRVHKRLPSNAKKKKQA